MFQYQQTKPKYVGRYLQNTFNPMFITRNRRRKCLLPGIDVENDETNKTLTATTLSKE